MSTRFGCEVIDLFATQNHTDPLSRVEPSPQEFIDELEKFCRSAQLTGLPCIISAMSFCGKRFSNSFCRVVINRLELSSTSLKGQVTASYDPKSGSDVIPIHVNLTLLKSSFKFRLARDTERVPALVKDVQVLLHGIPVETLDRHRTNGHDRQLATHDELSALGQMCNEVLEQMCETLAFESGPAIVSLAAEAILRTVRFSSSSISLLRVRVRCSVGSRADAPFERCTGHFWDAEASPEDSGSKSRCDSRAASEADRFAATEPKESDGDDAQAAGQLKEDTDHSSPESDCDSTIFYTSPFM